MKRRAGAGEGPDQRRAPIFTRDFVLLCLTSFASFMAMQTLIPTLPLYLKSLGGQDADIGLVFGVFSLAALASRFVAGPMLDLWGRKRPLFVGAVLFLAAMALYNFATTVPILILLRILHGVGFGIVGTSASALAADLAPPERRGEALGWYGNFASVSMAVSPSIGIWLMSVEGLPLGGFSLLFAVGSAVVALELLFVVQIRDTSRPAGRRLPLTILLSPSRIFCPAALPIALAMLFGSCTFGAVLSFVPIYLAAESTASVSYFFLLYAVVMTASRPTVGRLADRFDRRLVAVPAMLFSAIGVSIFAIAPSLPVALAAAVVFGVGSGSLNPILMALVVDVVKPRERGAAIGTFFASIDVGIGVGSMSLGLVAQAFGYRAVFLAAGGVCLVGLIYWVLYQRLSPRAT